MKYLAILAVATFTLVTASPASAFPLLAEWTFEVSVPTTAGPHAAEGGVNAGASSPGSGFHAGTTAYSNPVGNGTAESFSSTGWAVGDYYEFCTSTVGYSGITLDWEQGSSNTGPRDFEVQYNVNGGSFTTIGGTHTVLANASPNPTWSSSTYQPIYHLFQDLSSVSAVDNQNTVCLRIVNNSTVSANGGTVASTGTSRVDTVQINGVPEPATLSLLALGGLALIRRRR